MAAKRLCVALAGACATTMCIVVPARSEPDYTLSDTVAIFAPSDRAAIYLLREEFVRSISHLPPEWVYLDNAPLGILPQQSYVAAMVEPGTHCITGIGEGADLCLELRSGSTCFLRLREVIDEQDQVIREWVLDSPEFLRDVLKKKRLQLAQPTGRGRAQLAKRASRAARSSQWETEHRQSAAVTYPLTLNEMWYEDPLDPVNLKHELERRRIGRLTVATDTIRYACPMKSITIPADRIIAVRFGGTRFTGRDPWVEIQYGTERGIRHVVLRGC